ncbi:hypothetical protein Tco_1343966 [Tanacetum coccineum]
MYYPRFTKVIIHHFLTKDKKISKRNKIGMHTSRDDYLINTLRFVSIKEESQIYGARLPKSMTSPEMRETKSYKIYLGYAIGVTPPKKPRKFKKPASLKLFTVSASPEEPTRKLKRVKRPAKKSSDAPTAGVVIIEAPMKSLSKKKEKMTVEKRKGIDLLSEVALTEGAQYEEVCKKSLRDFHKTHPSGSGTATKIAPSAAKIKPSVINEGTGVKPGVPDVTKEELTESEAESWGKDEDDRNIDHDSRSEGSDQERDSGDDNTQCDSEKGSDFKHETDENESGSESDQEENEEEIDNDEEEEKDEFVKTLTNDTDDEDETKIKDKTKGEEDEGIDYTTNQFDDDVNITLNQVIEDAHVTLSTVTKKTEVLVTSSSHSSDLASKFLNFSDIPHTDAEIVSLMDVHVHHEIPSNQTSTLLTVPISVITESSPIYTTVIPQSLPSFAPLPPQSTPTPPPITEATNPPYELLNFASVFQFNNRVTALEKEVDELKKNDPLNTQVTALVDEHLDLRLGATRDEFISYISTSITGKITEQVKSQLPQILPKEVSNFAPLVIKSMVTESLEHAVLAKESSQPNQSYLTAAEHRECYDGLIKSYDLDKSLFSTYNKVYSLKRSRKDKDKDETLPLDETENQKENLGNDDEEPKRKVASKRDWFTKPKQPEDPTDLDWNVGKTSQQGPTQSWLMTLASSANKPSKTFNELMSTPINFSAYIMNSLKITNLTQETLLGPAFKLLKGTRTNYAKLEYDFEECYKALSEKLDWDNLEGGDYPFDLTKPLPLVMNRNRQMTKAAQYDLPGIEDMVQNIWSPVKVTYDKHALWVTRVEVMRKHGYGYLREIEVKRVDNDLYTFKEGDFPRLRINDIKDMLILIVQNRLTNLSGDDVFDFAIALRMFTRSMVIQKRVKDLQLGVESYQKKINVTKLETTRPGIRKKDP